MNIKAEDIKVLTDDKPYIHLTRAADGDSYAASESGKAICLESNRAASNQKFWFPVSILRKTPNSNPCFGNDLLAPRWFIAKNDLWQHFA